MSVGFGVQNIYERYVCMCPFSGAYALFQDSLFPAMGKQSNETCLDFKRYVVELDEE